MTSGIWWLKTGPADVNVSMPAKNVSTASKELTWKEPGEESGHAANSPCGGGEREGEQR